MFWGGGRWLAVAVVLGLCNVRRVQRDVAPSKERACKSNHAKCRNSSANQMDAMGVGNRNKKENGMKRFETHPFQLASQRPKLRLELLVQRHAPNQPQAATQPPAVRLEPPPPSTRCPSAQQQKERGLAAAPRWMTNAFLAQHRIGSVGLVGLWGLPPETSTFVQSRRVP